MLDLKTIQELCRRIAAEQEPIKAHRLLLELRRWIDIETDEARMRLRIVAKQLRKVEADLDSLESPELPKTGTDN